MSFRRSKQQADSVRAWREFIQSHEQLLQASGVPANIYQSREMFDDLLMHGHIDHHQDPTRFSVGNLSQEQQTLLTEIVAAYLQAGFSDPGIGGSMTKIGEDARHKVADFR